MEPSAADSIADIVNEFKTDGYDPVVMATRTLTSEEIKEFDMRYQNACSSLVNVDSKIRMIFAEYQSNLEFVGIAGLAQNVANDTKETVRIATEAGIKMWMLTGSDQESTISAAYTAGLISKNTEVANLKKVKTSADLIKIVERHITQE